MKIKNERGRSDSGSGESVDRGAGRTESASAAVAEKVYPRKLPLVSTQIAA